MRAINRLPLPFGPQHIELELGDGDEIVRVGIVRDGGMEQPSLWVLQRPGAERAKRSFHVVGDYVTAVEDTWEYVGSYAASATGAVGGPTMTWHLFADVPSAR